MAYVLMINNVMQDVASQSFWEARSIRTYSCVGIELEVCPHFLHAVEHALVSKGSYASFDRLSSKILVGNYPVGLGCYHHTLTSSGS